MMEMKNLLTYADINGRPMKSKQIAQYLQKLQLADLELTPDLETLTKLQDAHLKYVPYENFDCMNGKITSLKRQDMFEKVIMHNRGGICFELNGLFNIGAREAIGRAKMAPQEEYEKVYDGILDEMQSEIDEVVRGGEEQ